jgi:hypothetical protein
MSVRMMPKPAGQQHLELAGLRVIEVNVDAQGVGDAQREDLGGAGSAGGGDGE